MASDRNYLPRRWDYLNVEETPGTFRRLTEEETQIHESPTSMPPPPEPANGKLKTTKNASASLPRTKRKDSPSVFKAFSWSRKSRPVMTLDEDLKQEDTVEGLATDFNSSGELQASTSIERQRVERPEDLATDSENRIMDSPNNGAPPSENIVCAVSPKKSQSLSVSRTSSNSSNNSGVKNATTKSEKTVTLKKLSSDGADDQNVARNPPTTDIVTIRDQKSGQKKTEEDSATQSTNGNTENSKTKQRVEQTLSADDDEDEEAGAEPRVTYLGPVVLSPKGTQKGQYVHITVVPGSEVEESSRTSFSDQRQVARVYSDSHGKCLQ